MGQRSEAELNDLPCALVDLTLNLRGQCGKVKGQDGMCARGQRVKTVQTAVGCSLGTVRLHDALKMATEGVLTVSRLPAGAAEQKRGFESR